jgi:hypothetical protein
MRVGEPFRLSDVVPADVDRRTAKGLATTAIMARIATLLPPRHRGVYVDSAAQLERGDEAPVAPKRRTRRKPPVAEPEPGGPA